MQLFHPPHSFFPDKQHIDPLQTVPFPCQAILEPKQHKPEMQVLQLMQVMQQQQTFSNLES